MQSFSLPAARALRAASRCARAECILLPVEFEPELVPAEPVPEALLLELPLRPVLLPLVPEPDVSAEVMPDAPVPELPAPEVPVPGVEKARSIHEPCSRTAG